MTLPSASGSDQEDIGEEQLCQAIFDLLGIKSLIGEKIKYYILLDELF